jgi:hypothetical protein
LDRKRAYLSFLIFIFFLFQFITLLNLPGDCISKHDCTSCKATLFLFLYVGQIFVLSKRFFTVSFLFERKDIFSAFQEKGLLLTRPPPYLFPI